MIADIRLQRFRSYTDARFVFGEGANIIVGPNASGKTNLLEAVLVAARGNSYRAKDSELVQFGSDWARVDAHTPTQTRVVKLVTEPKPQKTFVIDDQSLARLLPARTMPVVLFEPNHLLLLSGSPDLRRSFMDDLIEQTVPGFGATRKHYRRILAQRNALLKRNPPNLAEQLFMWNLRLSELGGQIAQQRQHLLERFNLAVSDLYCTIAGHTNTIVLEYQSKFLPQTYETQMLHKLESNIQLDILRGYTVYGPHRDDMMALIDGHAMQEAASRGETRTLVLALKILELQLLEEVRQEKPLLLLDDVFGELDMARRLALTTHLQSHQTFITTTDADVVAKHFAHCTTIALTKG
jgi:DNA replication and repair protein RecF